MTRAEPPEPRPVVILGASNVTFALPVIWNLLTSLSQPVRLVIAAGHGRSFGLPNTVLGRTLPSILSCDLWSQLQPLTTQRQEMAERKDQPAALITDVGNDLLYGATPETIAGWVDRCVRQLMECGYRPTLAGLPLESLQRLGPRRFRFFRRLLFPGSALRYENALPLALEMQDRLRELASEAGLTFLPVAAHWYGFDPIHIRRAQRRAAWRTLLGAAIASPEVDEANTPRRNRVILPHQALHLWTRKPAVLWYGQRRIETTQPALPVGSGELWLY